VIEPDQLTDCQMAALQMARDGLEREGSCYRAPSPFAGTFQRRTINALQRYGLVQLTDHARIATITSDGIGMLERAASIAPAVTA
jgi:hypothetical protein